MTSVNTNISASKASLAMSNAHNAQVQSAQRLSSGRRINGGADDAAGLSVSSKMNAIFMGQKAAIKTATDADRGLAQLESDALMEQFLMVTTGTKFNEKQVLNGALGDTLDIQSGPTASETFTIAMVPGGAYHTQITGTSMNKISSQSDAQNALDTLGGPINTFLEAKATLGASINRLNHTISYLSHATVYTETANGRIVDADFAKRGVNKFEAIYSIPSCIADALNCERYETKFTAAF